VSFTFRIRVYYEDTDTGGIVFYANYLKFFERARTEWLRAGRMGAGGPGAAGVSQQQIADELGLLFVVRSTAVQYHRPARLDDLIRIESAVERAGRVGIDFVQQAFLDTPDGAGPLLASGRIQVACVTKALRPAQIPAGLRAIFVDGESV
jgi:acyl-CoA thioester hydrolase